MRPARPHALQSVSAPATTSYAYDANGNLLTASGGKYRMIAYTSFDLPDSQTGAQGPSGPLNSTWLYDESHTWIKEVHVDAGGTRTTWYQHPDSQGQTAVGASLSAGSPLWQARVVNAWGRTEQQGFGNSVAGRATYEAATGRTTDLSAGLGSASTVLDLIRLWPHHSLRGHARRSICLDDTA